MLLLVPPPPPPPSAPSFSILYVSFHSARLFDHNQQKKPGQEGHWGTLMTSDDVCAVIGPQMWIAGEEGKYTEMLARHKSQKTSGIMMQESIYEQVEPLRRLFVLFVCISFCVTAAADGNPCKWKTLPVLKLCTEGNNSQSCNDQNADI